MRAFLFILIVGASCWQTSAQVWSGTTPGNIHYTPGLVGIGTSTPKARLHVADGDLLLQSTTSGYPILWSKNVDGLKSLRLDFNSLLVFNDDFLISAQHGKHLVLNTYNNAGHVGIGTTLPGAKLEVHEPKPLGTFLGNSQLLHRVSGNAGNYVMKNLWLYRDSDGDNWWTSRLHDGISVDGSYLTPGVDTRTWWERDPMHNIQSWGHNKSTYLTINQGYVGIGTSSPETDLHVAGYSRFNQFGWFSRSNYGQLASALHLGQNYQWDAPVVDIKTSDNGGSNESFWLGTRWGHYLSYQRNSSAGVKNMLRLGGDDNHHFLSVYSIDGTSEKIKLVADGTSYVQGQVGIGTSNPGSYKLAVEGKIGARKIVVTQTSWADYVFEPTYLLPTLQEVETFIQQNKHLPGVPSTKEVEAQGLDVGDNQAVLLKKIEELTLYIIDQNKKVERLEKEMETLKKNTKRKPRA